MMILGAFGCILQFSFAFSFLFGNSAIHKSFELLFSHSHSKKIFFYFEMSGQVAIQPFSIKKGAEISEQPNDNHSPVHTQTQTESEVFKAGDGFSSITCAEIRLCCYWVARDITHSRKCDCSVKLTVFSFSQRRSEMYHSYEFFVETRHCNTLRHRLACPDLHQLHIPVGIQWQIQDFPDGWGGRGCQSQRWRREPII